MTAPRQLDKNLLGDHVDRLYRAAWALTGNPHDAEDLVQETYVKVLARPRFLRHDDDLGYLLRALRNQFISGGRRRAARPEEVPLPEGELPLSNGRFDRRRPELAFEVVELFAAISALPDDQRDAVAAVDVAGLSYGEAASLLRCKEATLTTRLYRARQQLASLLATEVRTS